MQSDMTKTVTTRGRKPHCGAGCACAVGDGELPQWKVRPVKHLTFAHSTKWGHVFVAVVLCFSFQPSVSAELTAPSPSALGKPEGVGKLVSQDGHPVSVAQGEVRVEENLHFSLNDAAASSARATRVVSGSASSDRVSSFSGFQKPKWSGRAETVGLSTLQTSLTSKGGPTGSELPEKPSERHYICRYSKGNGGVCGWRGSSTLPTGLYCPAGNCCSKTACRNGQCNGFCDTAWALCSSVAVYHDEFSYGKCSCARLAHRCPSNSTCYDDSEDMGGAYCLCEEGYYLKGDSCVQSPCKLTDCNPGKCSLAEDESPQCQCPTGYTAMKSGGVPYCQMSDPCRDSPCGRNGEALSCAATSPDHYTCTCASGYSLTYVNSKATCATKWSLTKCFDLPCGSEGVNECQDTPDGPVCVCKKGYKLQDAENGKKCVFDNPCDSNICGPPSIVLSCTANTAGYSCQCQTGYSVTTTEKAQYCEAEDGWESYKTYVYIAAAAGGVIILALLFCAFARSQRNTSDTLNTPVYSHEQQPMMAGGFGQHQPQQFAVQPSPSQWG